MRRSLVAVAISLALGGIAQAAPADAGTTPHPPLVRATTQLPRTVVPSHYAI